MFDILFKYIYSLNWVIQLTVYGKCLSSNDQRYVCLTMGQTCQKYRSFLFTWRHFLSRGSRLRVCLVLSIWCLKCAGDTLGSISLILNVLNIMPFGGCFYLNGLTSTLLPKIMSLDGPSGSQSTGTAVALLQPLSSTGFLLLLLPKWCSTVCPSSYYSVLTIYASPPQCSTLYHCWCSGICSI